MHPTPPQQLSIDRMNEVLAGNGPAQALAQKLWQFYSFRLSCTLRDDDGQPSTCHLSLPAFVRTGRIGDAAPRVIVRRTDRTAEALTHELLHLELAADGFPRLHFVPPLDFEKNRLAATVQNLADHVVMLPRFLALGYDEAKFTGLANLTEAELQLASEVTALSDLSTPAGYVAALTGYLNGKADLNWVTIKNI